MTAKFSLHRGLCWDGAGSPALGTVSCGTTTRPLPCEKNPFHPFLQLYKAFWISPNPCALSSWMLSHCTCKKHRQCCSGVRFSTASPEIFYQETVSPPWHACVIFLYLMNTVTTAHFIQDAALTVHKKMMFSIQGHQGKKLSLWNKGVFLQC